MPYGAGFSIRNLHNAIARRPLVARTKVSCPSGGVIVLKCFFLQSTKNNTFYVYMRLLFLKLRYSVFMVKKWKIAYISSIVCQSDEAFEEILQKSRVNNARSDITGVLLRDAKSYFQYLEGPKFEIGECILRIAADHRHEAMTILMSMPAQVVFFDGWTLAEAQLPKRRKSLSSFARLLLKSEVNERIALIEKACMEAVPK